MTSTGARIGRWTSIAAVGLYAAAAPDLLPQKPGRIAISNDSVPNTIAVAESLGARHPRPVGGDRRQHLTGEEPVGTDHRRCIEIGNQNVARSGEFIVGPFVSYLDIWLLGYAKIWWSPTTVAGKATLGTGPPLIVQAIRLDSVAPAIVFEEPVLARTIPNSALFRPVEPVEATLFYATEFRLPTPGRWLLVGRAGNNWGCFVYWLGARR